MREHRAKNIGLDEFCTPNRRTPPLHEVRDEPLELPPTPINWRAVGLAVALVVVAVGGAWLVHAVAVRP